MKRSMIRMMTGAEPLLRVAGFGFLFWAAFMLALDPDLIFGTARGWLPAVDEDAARITGASSLGAIMAVVQFILAERLPIGRRAVNLAVHLGACAGLALAAITIAELMAPLVIPASSQRIDSDLGEAFASDFLLLLFGLALFAVLLHFPRSRDVRPAEAPKPAPAPSYAQRIPVQTRGGVLVVDVRDIDWIEAQGNYAALHVGGRSHILRETLASLVARLDPAQFVRIHRGAIVNLSRIQRTKPLRSGDATVELADGVELRASRTFAGVLREKIRCPD